MRCNDSQIRKSPPEPGAIGVTTGGVENGSDAGRDKHVRARAGRRADDGLDAYGWTIAEAVVAIIVIGALIGSLLRSTEFNDARWLQKEFVTLWP